MTDDEIFVLAVNSASTILGEQLLTSESLKKSREFEKVIVEVHSQILQAEQTIFGKDLGSMDTDTDLGPQS